MKGKHYKIKNTKKQIENVIVKTIFLICFLVMIFAGVKIINWIKENKKNKDIKNNISNFISIDKNKTKVEKYQIDFEKLKQINSQTIAWFKVNGTNIEYPIVKNKNNDYYLTHSFDNSYNSSGWVFIDYNNKVDGTDKNIVIYGHNRKNGSMLGTLKNILSKDWQSNPENYIIPFITEKENAEYEVFSVYKIEKEDYYITTSFKNDEEFQKFIDKIKLRSENDFGVNITTKDSILTLSTCANDNRYRVVLHAKKIK